MKIINLAVLRSMVILAGLVWVWFPISPTSAETAVTLDLKVRDYEVSSVPLPAGDEEGHFIGVSQREGEAVSSHAGKAKYSTVFTFESRRGQVVRSKGYAKLSYDDGSWISLDLSSETSAKMDGLLSTRGHGTIIKGGGRFKGIIGGAVFSGKELRPVSQDPKRTMDMNLTLFYKLP